MGHQRVPAFVVRKDPLLLLRHHSLLLQAADHAFHRGFEVRVADVLQLLSARKDGRLVDDVREICAGEAGRLARDLYEVHVGGEWFPARVHAQDRFAPREVRWWDEHLTVEAARTQERGVEILQTIRGAHDDHLVAGTKAVQLDEQLVQRLVLFTVEAVAGALCPDRIELVDEDDRRRVLARLVEELADARGAEAGEHLHEGGCALRKERGARLVRDRLGEQRLARSRRPVQEDAFGHTCAQSLEALRMPQEVHDLHQLCANFLDTSDVAPRHRRTRAGGHVSRADARHHPQRSPEQEDDQACEDEEAEREPVHGPLAEFVQQPPHVRHDTAIGAPALSLERGTRSTFGFAAN